MAKYRPVSVKIWSDPCFQEYSPIAKLVFIYLCTNKNTTESGVYTLSMKSISFDTGVDKSGVDKVLFGELKEKVKYDKDEQVVFVVNFLRYNFKGNRVLLNKSLQSDYRGTKSDLWLHFINTYPAYEMLLKSADYTESDINSISIRDSNEDKETDTPRFDEIWERYPNKMDRKKALSHFRASVKTDRDWSDINIALDKYVKYIEVEEVKPKYIKHGKTWFNNWRDWFSYEPPKRPNTGMPDVLPTAPCPKCKAYWPIGSTCQRCKGEPIKQPNPH